MLAAPFRVRKRDALLVLTLLAATAAIAALSAAPALAAKAGWKRGYTVTEYYPAPEAWANGKRVKIPGVRGASGRIDWLYGARGIAMEGDGVSVDGQRFHIYKVGSQGWVKRNGRPTSASSGFAQGRPFWRDVGWRTRRGRVTYPLPGKRKWSAGKPRRRGKGSARRPISFRGIKFKPGPSRPLHYWRSVAVDPGRIPLGSKVYIPAYSSRPGGGCFRAADTGSAINGKHLDVYRPPPSSPSGANSYSGQRVYVVPKGKRVPKRAPRCLRGKIRGGSGGSGGGEGGTGGGTAPSAAQAGLQAADGMGGNGGRRAEGVSTYEPTDATPAIVCGESRCVQGSRLGGAAIRFALGVAAFLFG